MDWNSIRNAFSRKGSKQELSRELASRQRSIDFAGLIGILPNPDPVLKKKNMDITVYRDIESDAHAGAVVGSRKAGLLSREWSVEPGDDSQLAQQAADICNEVFENLPMNDILSEQLNAVLFGYACQEIMWANMGEMWLPVTIEEKPQEWFGFDEENRLRFLSRENMVEGELLPARKFLLTRLDASYVNPYGRGVLSRCFWPYIFKKGGMKFWVTFAEKYGMPFMVGKLPRGASEKEHNELLDKLDGMVQDAIATIPDDGSVDILSDVAKGDSSDLYDKLRHAMNSEMSKAVLGQTLTTEMSQSGGSYSASKTHQEVRGDLIEGDCKRSEQTMNQLIDWICEFNIPSAPRPKFGFVEEEDLQTERAKRDEALTKQGVKFRKSYYIKTYNLEEEDFDLADPGTDTGKPVDFAESTTVRQEQETLDQLADDAAARIADPVGESIFRILQLMDEVDSFDEFNERLLRLYPDMDPDQKAELIAQATFMSDAWGRLNA